MKRAPLLAALLLAACDPPHPASVGQVFGPTDPPGLRFAAASSFAPLPPIAYATGADTEAERHVFVELGADRSVVRMIAVQFDRTRPGGAFVFGVPQRTRRGFGGQVWQSWALAYDDGNSATRWPDSAEGRTRALLLAHHLKPPRVWKLLRLARLADPAGRGEVNIYYLEAADSDFPEGLPRGSKDLSFLEGERLFNALRRAMIALR